YRGVHGSTRFLIGRSGAGVAGIYEKKVDRRNSFDRIRSSSVLSSTLSCGRAFCRVVLVNR
ncbi:MAG TPA: hypothetical protein VLT13_03085, partial [Bacteroidota bacterium]|nr:hypothetical protein [Bacteroidota bacterium]